MTETNGQKVDFSERAEYLEGYQDYKENGSRNMKCPGSPYDDDRKTVWLVGWLDARSEDIFGAVAETV